MIHDTRYVFFGTPEFAAVILEKLIGAGFVPSAVVCNPDRPVGRKKIVTPPPVKKSIEYRVSSIKSKIKIFQPETVQDLLNTRYQLQATNPDIFVVAAYAKILPKKILETPRLGAVGVHPSLLPRHRGSSPIQTAILNGDKETGVTLYVMDEKMDHGPILAQRKLANCDLGTVHYETLSGKLAALGADLLVETLPKYLAGEIAPAPQRETEATFTKKFIRADAYVKPEDLAEAREGRAPRKAAEIGRKIRVFDPEPGAWTVLDGKQVKLLAAEEIGGVLKLTRIQIEGKKPTQLSTS